MKTLKLEHQLADDIRGGLKRSTWRMFDDKDISVGDELELIDKSDPGDPNTWQVFARAKVIEITEKFLKNVKDEDFKGHEQFDSPKEMLMTYQGYYGGQVNMDTPVKIIRFELENDDKTIPQTDLKEAKLFTDGGSRGNPGPSAIAFVICKMDNSVVEKSGEYIGETTNNQAEYQALKMGLKRAQELGIKDLIVNMDSELVVKQINGLYKMKNADLRPHYEEVKQLEGQFDKITFNHVPRKLNADADAEVNRILDQEAKK